MTASAHRRAFSWLIGLLLFHLLLLSVQVRTPEGQLLLRSVGLTLLTPFASGVHFISSSFTDFLDRYVFLQDAQSENQRLVRENDQLRLELHRLQELVAMLPRSPDYQALQHGRSFRTVLADVVGRTSPFLSPHLILNQGTRAGVSYDSAVITPRGIVGRVISVGPFGAEVELVTNARAAAGARLEESRWEGVVLGRGDGWLDLEYISVSQPVAVGETVITSGSDRIYPKGLPIGTVEAVDAAPHIYQKIRVRPAVNLSLLEEVLVVVGQAPGPPRSESPDPAEPAAGAQQEARRH